MSNTDRRPFTAATDTFAYAQVFTRATVPSHDAVATNRHSFRLARMLPRGGRGTARHAAGV